MLSAGDMKVLILGASGIIGQHLRLALPAGVEAIWHRRKADLAHVGFDLERASELPDWLDSQNPEAIINLAGENSVDAAERDPAGASRVNEVVPGIVSAWCMRNSRYYVHVSTQAVFGGTRPPYSADADLANQDEPVNEYGRQKRRAEQTVRDFGSGWTIIRLTFILGIRPMLAIGRANPVEQMFAGQQPQVADRYFSPLFARDAARLLWFIVQHPEQWMARTAHLGLLRRVSRQDVALWFNDQSQASSHADFTGLAPRPLDTTYGEGSLFLQSWHQGLGDLRREWDDRQSLALPQRARELALFLGIPEAESYARLSRGFLELHADIREDYGRRSKTDEEILTWYRETEGYLWELSSYHCDPGFNYDGFCRGIAERLAASGARRVLCLGDGIGDLSLGLRRAGIGAVYNDLADSMTARFARFRHWMYTGEPLPERCTTGWRPGIQNGAGPWDAVVAADFLEHLPCVENWVVAVRDSLAPGGLFCAQNAFGCGSGPDGSIPMHLACNDRYVTDWDPLLAQLGFRQESSNWYRKQS